MPFPDHPVPGHPLRSLWRAIELQLIDKQEAELLARVARVDARWLGWPIRSHIDPDAQRYNLSA